MWRSTLFLELHNWSENDVVSSKGTLFEVREIPFPREEICLLAPRAEHHEQEILHMEVRGHWTKLVRVLDLANDLGRIESKLFCHLNSIDRRQCDIGVVGAAFLSSIAKREQYVDDSSRTADHVSNRKRG